jgi:hypothetical protein
MRSPPDHPNREIQNQPWNRKPVSPGGPCLSGPERLPQTRRCGSDRRSPPDHPNREMQNQPWNRKPVSPGGPCLSGPGRFTQTHRHGSEDQSHRDVAGRMVTGFFTRCEIAGGRGGGTRRPGERIPGGRRGTWRWSGAIFLTSRLRGCRGRGGGRSRDL